MTFSEYQKLALETDQARGSADLTVRDSVIVPLLGLAGEAGELLSEYKKQIRDGASHTLHGERVQEELGIHFLWMISPRRTSEKHATDGNPLETRSFPSKLKRFRMRASRRSLMLS
jgi:hypothetical protein